jgi:regulator of replication initiation timing
MERDSLEKASALCSALLKGGIVPQQRRIILLHLRQLNRQLYQSLIGARRQLGDLKNSLDSLDTSLVALRYERRHLHSQIEACQDTTHLYTSIELEAAADDALENGHEAMQLRLQRELEQRQSLQGHLDRLLKSKQEAERSLTSRKRRLEELRSNLQQMLKGSKAVAVASKFDWEALKRAQREAEMIDSMASGNDRQEGKDNLSALTDLYERLVVFVSERPEFRLRFFAEAAIHIAEDGDDDAAPENDALSSANRHPNIPKAAYIQMTLDSGSHTADFFMKCSPGWLLTIESSLLPSPWTSSSSFESWALNAIKPVELSNSGEVGWLSASWLHSLACGELPEEDIAAFFETAREALQARSSLLRVL